MKTTFLRSKSDMKWLRDVHLPRLPRKYRSAVVYGNEDCPPRVEVFTRARPNVKDRPLIFISDSGSSCVLHKHRKKRRR